MIIVRGPSMANRIANPEIRSLVQQRFTEILADASYDYDQHGYTIVVEPGDTVKALEKETRCAIMRNLFDATRYGHPHFVPSFEALQEHPTCYEMVFILNDEGFGITIFIPKTKGIATKLLAMCAEHAEPQYAMPELTQP